MLRFTQIGTIVIDLTDFHIFINFLKSDERLRDFSLVFSHATSLTVLLLNQVDLVNGRSNSGCQVMDIRRQDHLAGVMKGVKIATSLVTQVYTHLTNILKS